MRILILLLSIIIPLKEVESVKLSFPAQAHQYEIFIDYENDNFSQNFNLQNGRMTADIKSINFSHLNLNFRIFLDQKLLGKLDSERREIVLSLLDNSFTLEHYFRNMSLFLEKDIKYTEEKLPQDEISVLLSRKANCIGYSNLAGFLLNCVGIKHKFIKGFYLKRENGQTLKPIPHKWIEIHLSKGICFFYDPQRQRFSANYLVIRDDVDFTKVRKFEVMLIEKSKKILN